MRWRLIATTGLGIGLSAAAVGACAFAFATLLTPAGVTVAVPKGSFLADAPQDPLVQAPLMEARRTPPAVGFDADALKQSLGAQAPIEPVDKVPEAPAGPRPLRHPSAPANAPTAEAAPHPLPRIRQPQERPAEPPARVAALPPRAVEPGGSAMLSPGEVRRMRLALRLTPEQEVHWPPVEAVLLQIGAQQATLARQGQDVAGALTSDATMRVYWAARPLLGVLREDQKVQIRHKARTMGFGSVASYL